jgi:signal transduction histidine kinase
VDEWYFFMDLFPAFSGWIAALLSLLTLALAGGALLLVWGQPEGWRPHGLFVGLCAVLAVWGALHLFRLDSGGLGQVARILSIPVWVVGAVYAWLVFRARLMQGSARTQVFAGLLIAALVSDVLYVLVASALGIPLLNGLLDIVSAGLTLIATGWLARFALQTYLREPLSRLNDDSRGNQRSHQQTIVELQRQKAMVTQLTQDLQTASEAKSNFLSNMGLELRTPLNSIVGYSELLQSGIYGELDATQLDRLEKIHRNGRYLLDLINNVLDLSKIETGRINLETSVFHIERIIEQAVIGVEAEYTRKGLIVKVSATPNLPTLYGDEGRIQQVLTNLLTNAIKFTDQGSITVEAILILVEHGTSAAFKLPFIGWLGDGSWIIITVTDTGIGIAPEDQARIFEEFGRADSARAAHVEGTGLGLAIAKKLVELHQGSIWVKSALGQGSTFFVALPAHEKPKPEDSKRASHNQSMPQDAPTTEPALRPVEAVNRVSSG